MLRTLRDEAGSFADGFVQDTSAVVDTMQARRATAWWHAPRTHHLRQFGALRLARFKRHVVTEVLEAFQSSMYRRLRTIDASCFCDRTPGVGLGPGCAKENARQMCRARLRVRREWGDGPSVVGVVSHRNFLRCGAPRWVGCASASREHCESSDPDAYPSASDSESSTISLLTSS